MNNTKQCILIVDDTPVQLRILSQILSSAYDIRVATSGQKGLEIAEKHPIDLILLDIMMFGMSGFEVLAALKKSEKTKHIPVIFISAMNTSEHEIKGVEAGAVDYITKPFVHEVVRLRIDLHMKLISQTKTLEKQGMYDSLTEISNRRCFNQVVESQWHKAIENGHCLSLVIMDIDNFTAFNEKYGQLSGDICLRTVAKALTAARQDDLIFRFNGDEFAFLLPDMNASNTEILAERLVSAVSEIPIEYHPGKSANVTISVGLGTIFPNESERPEFLCITVEKALKEAKNNGGNTFVAASFADL